MKNPSFRGSAWWSPGSSASPDGDQKQKPPPALPTGAWVYELCQALVGAVLPDDDDYDASLLNISRLMERKLSRGISTHKQSGLRNANRADHQSARERRTAAPAGAIATDRAHRPPHNWSPSAPASAEREQEDQQHARRDRRPLEVLDLPPRRPAAPRSRCSARAGETPQATKRAAGPVRALACRPRRRAGRRHAERDDVGERVELAPDRGRLWRQRATRPSSRSKHQCERDQAARDSRCQRSAGVCRYDIAANSAPVPQAALPTVIQSAR